MSRPKTSSLAVIATATVQTCRRSRTCRMRLVPLVIHIHVSSQLATLTKTRTTLRQVIRTIPREHLGSFFFCHFLGSVSSTCNAMALNNTSVAYADGGDGDGKVTICHVPQGNPDNAHTRTVSENAVAADLAHGDYLGECKKY